MRVQIKANVRDAEYQVTLYEGGPDNEIGDLKSLLAEACQSVLAAEGAV